MSDLIDRQNAIDVLEILADKMSDAGQTVMAQAVAVLKDLRSAEPEWALESAIDYLHSVGWLQEHDRILTESAEPERKGMMTTHEVACLLAELFEDPCACNYNGVDEWLPFKCELQDACPHPVGVACWEQFLKYRGDR